MLAANYDITIDRAAEYSFVLTVQDELQQVVDISEDTSFYSDIRETLSKKEAVSFTPVLIDGGVGGKVSFNLSEANTLVLMPNRSYEYDIFMRISGKTKRLLFGKVFVRANITKGGPIDPTN
jgi:hypothetical protein